MRLPRVSGCQTNGDIPASVTPDSADSCLPLDHSLNVIFSRAPQPDAKTLNTSRGRGRWGQYDQITDETGVSLDIPGFHDATTTSFSCGLSPNKRATTPRFGTKQNSGRSAGLCCYGLVYLHASPVNPATKIEGGAILLFSSLVAANKAYHDLRFYFRLINTRFQFQNIARLGFG